MARRGLITRMVRTEEKEPAPFEVITAVVLTRVCAWVHAEGCMCTGASLQHTMAPVRLGCK